MEDEPKKPRRKKIRPLVKKIERNNRDNRRSTGIIIISFAILLIGFFIQIKGYKKCDFKSAFERNINKLLYGDEWYCHREINIKDISLELENNILGQEDAIKLINASLNLAQREKYIQIAFYGDVGVGKSYAAAIISRIFYWKNNVQRYSYEDTIDYAAKILSNLSKCGFNLVVIDDIQITQPSINNVEEIEDRVRNHSKQHGYKTILIFIFKGPQTELYALKDFVVIDFEPMTYATFLECINLQAKINNIELQASDVEELTMLNYTASGCKQISKRLNLISQKTLKI
jgi:Torsin